MSAGDDLPNIALVGFMASGKTSVGLALAALTGLPFRDVDRIVEESQRMRITEIFALRGEVLFRETEGRVFRELCEGSGQIIGCGGGTLLDPRNRSALRARCVAIWLKTSPEELIRRLEASEADARPLLRGEEPRIVVPSLLSAREGLYRGADLPVETDGKSVGDIASEIARRLALPSAGTKP